MQSAEINKLKGGTVVSLCTLVLTTVSWKTRTSRVQSARRCASPVCATDLPQVVRGAFTLGHRAGPSQGWTQPTVKCLECFPTRLVGVWA